MQITLEHLDAENVPTRELEMMRQYIQQKFKQQIRDVVKAREK